MTNFVEKHYSVDAGDGEKLDGCPYSLFEDGHDVQDYILPPRGYVFSKFTLEPLPDNQVYDGKLIAQYEKEPLKERITPVLHVISWILIAGVIIGIITFLTISVFNPKKPKNTGAKPELEIAVNDLDTVSSENSGSDIQEDTIVIVEQIIDNQEVTETSEPEVEHQQAVTDDNQLFRQEFWALIHQRELAMDAYDGLYKRYKGKVNGEEFDYLRFIILKDYLTYKDWSAKLREIPSAEIDSIETIETLKAKLKTIN